jgi:hypothetical protein
VEGGGAEAFLGAGVGAGIVIEAVVLCGGTVVPRGGAVALCGGTMALLGGAVALFQRSRKTSSRSFRRLCLVFRAAEAFTMLGELDY